MPCRRPAVPTRVSSNVDLASSSSEPAFPSHRLEPSSNLGRIPCLGVSRQTLLVLGNRLGVVVVPAAVDVPRSLTRQGGESIVGKAFGKGQERIQRAFPIPGGL